MGFSSCWRRWIVFIRQTHTFCQLKNKTPTNRGFQGHGRWGRTFNPLNNLYHLKTTKVPKRVRFTGICLLKTISSILTITIITSQLYFKCKQSLSKLAFSQNTNGLVKSIRLLYNPDSTPERFLLRCD